MGGATVARLHFRGLHETLSICHTAWAVGMRNEVGVVSVDLELLLTAGVVIHKYPVIIVVAERIL
jgi:hypothetical protein